jgi:hypothetical protein
VSVDLDSFLVVLMNPENMDAEYAIGDASIPKRVLPAPVGGPLA